MKSLEKKEKAQDLSHASTSELLEELYLRNDVWIPQHFDATHIFHLSPKKITMARARGLLKELKYSDSDYLSEILSERIAEEIIEIVG